MIINSNYHNQVNLYGSDFEYKDRKNYVIYLTFGFTFNKFLRTSKLRKFITYPMFAFPFFSLLFCRENFNPYLSDKINNIQKKEVFLKQISKY